jgi:hypothetical protein
VSFDSGTMSGFPFIEAFARNFLKALAIGAAQQLQLHP